MSLAIVVPSITAAVIATLQAAQFNIRTQVSYNPSQAFDDDIRKSLVGEDQALLIATENKWLVLSWTRDVLRKSSLLGRRHRALLPVSTSPTQSKGFSVNFVECAFSFTFYGSYPDVVEPLEEYFLTKPLEGSFSVDYGVELGIFEVSMNNFELTGFQIEDSSSGSITALTTSVVVTYPNFIAIPGEDTVKMIDTINSAIYGVLDISNLVDKVILESTTIS